VRHGRGIRTWSTTRVMATKCLPAVCQLGLEGIVSKKLNAPYKSGSSKARLKIKNPNAPAATRAIEGTFWVQRR
jgi:ATP-dependent DNA ligase